MAILNARVRLSDGREYKPGTDVSDIASPGELESLQSAGVIGALEVEPDQGADPEADDDDDPNIDDDETELDDEPETKAVIPDLSLDDVRLSAAEDNDDVATFLDDYIVDVLIDSGIDTTQAVADRIADKTLQDIKGVGRATAKRIADFIDAITVSLETD
ncbi:MAG: hypothetical protein AAF958_14180 [Planctomycetota bacterium]